jgi:hypothetical protein
MIALDLEELTEYEQKEAPKLELKASIEKGIVFANKQSPTGLVIHEN